MTGPERYRKSENERVVDRWARERQEREALADRLAGEYLPDMPKHVADRTFAMAWEHGHGSGESDVENYYIDLADLAVTAFHQGWLLGQTHAAHIARGGAL